MKLAILPASAIKTALTSSEIGIWPNRTENQSRDAHRISQRNPHGSGLKVDGAWLSIDYLAQSGLCLTNELPQRIPIRPSHPQPKVVPQCLAVLVVIQVFRAKPFLILA